MLKIARCTVDWRSIRDLNSGGATNALSHFECDPFDLLGNAPYVNLQKSFPEKGEKSRREQQILSCRKCADFNDNTMENQEEFPKCRLDFECDPFDLLGNAPYVNLQKSFPEKGEKSRREQQILSCRKCADFNDNTMENQEEFPKCRLDFESISLRPLRYVCLFSFYRTAPHSAWKNARFRCKITMKSWVRNTR